MKLIIAWAIVILAGLFLFGAGIAIFLSVDTLSKVKFLGVLGLVGGVTALS